MFGINSSLKVKSKLADRKFAFTLAEVLITLGIIGIVASMTMPSLMASHQKKQTITRLKKAYSEINQAISLAQARNGLMQDWAFGYYPTYAEKITDFSDNYLLPYIKRVKTCYPIADCDPPIVYNLDGTPSPHAQTAEAMFYTPSGYSVSYWIHGAGDGGWFYIDVNGDKSPNTLGKDVFVFVMSWGNVKRKDYKLGFYPAGLHTIADVDRDDLIHSATLYNGTQYGTISGFACKADTGFSNAGGACAALLMYDDWQFSDDYPW